MNKRLALNILLLLGVICLFLFFRFYNITERFAFAWDQEHIANEVYKLLVDKKFTLIGPRANNDLGFYLGPYFTYLIAPFFAATHLHPNAMIFFVLIVALIFMSLSLNVISTIFTYPIALLFLFLWGLNPYLIQLDITAWWPVLIPGGSILFFFLVHRMHSAWKWYQPLLLGLLCGFYSNMHFQFAFISLVAVIVLLFDKKTIKKKAVNVGLYVVGFIATLLPLFLFDIRHNFLNLTLFINFFFGKTNSQIGSHPFAWVPVFLNIVKSFFPINNSVVLSFFGAGILFSPLFLSLSLKKREEKQLWIMVCILNIATILGFTVYGKRPSEYYFLFLLPFFTLTICRLGMLNNFTKTILATFIVLSVYMNISIYKRMFTLPAYAYMALKEKTILEIKKYAADKKINVSFQVPVGDNNGYRYFMKIHNVMESGNWNDPLIQVQIPPQEGNIIISPDISIKIPAELKK